MKIQQYQIEAKRTLPTLKNEDWDRQHMLAGIITEVGEIADIYKRWIAYNKTIDKTNLREEIGDVFWYIVNWANIRNVQLEGFKDKHLLLEDDEPFEEYETEEEIDLLFRFLWSMNLGQIKGLSNMWYTVCKRLGFSDYEIELSLDINIAKLKICYPEKFNEEQALNRDLISERKVLENENK